MMALRVSPDPAPRRGPREVSIRELLEWAFGIECARLDFGDTGGIGAPRAAVGIEYVMMQRGLTGVRIDGGGVSWPHDDAEIVADAVAHLPEGCGGRSMAVLIAELARTGRCPDPMAGARPRLVPENWHFNRHGGRGATEDAAVLGPEGWLPQPRRNRKGVLVHDRVRFTPVTVVPTPCQIAAARRTYLGWWGALLHLRGTLQACDVLVAHRVTGVMPPRAPWQKKVDIEF